MIVAREKFRTSTLLLTIGLLISIGSAWVSAYTGNGDWFARSGAVLSFVSVVVQFSLSNIKKTELERLFKQDLH